MISNPTGFCGNRNFQSVRILGLADSPIIALVPPSPAGVRPTAPRRFSLKNRPFSIRLRLTVEVQLPPRKSARHGNAWIDGHAVCFQPSLRDGVVLRCRFPWTEVHGYLRPSLRDFDPRKLTPTSCPSRRPAKRKLLRVSAPLRDNKAVRSGACVPLAPLAPFALNGSKALDPIRAIRVIRS
jgi:hypothetical protein